MKEKQLTITSGNITQKQWSQLILELNLMKKAWANYATLDIVPVTKQVMEHMSLLEPVDCMEMCEILRLKLSGYVDSLNLHIMNDGSGYFYGCMCK